MSFITGPVAPESNPPIVPQYYAPSVYYITAISLGASTIVTTAANHNYVIGQNVRLHIPPTYGSFQLNGLDGYVTAIPNPNQVVININSMNANAFNASPAYGPTKPQICAIGDVNTGAPSNSTGRVLNATTIPGANINTSPIEGTWLD